MRQISHLVIENFQSHARSELALGPGLNVIVGPSDNGKSAVLRALRWALYNEPRGSEFVRAGARECRVTITMSDGAVITREMLLHKSGTPARNRYIVRTPDSGEQVFEGFGSEVPAEVTRAHGMPQVLLDTDKKVALSLGSQLEGPFLMTESGSLRARAIGRLLGVHVVDAALRGTQRDLRAARQDAARLEREVARCDEELKPFANIAELEARLLKAEAMLALAEERGQRLALLTAKLAGLNDLEERLAREREQARQNERDLRQSLAEYEETLRRLGRCPTCLQPVRPEAIPGIMADLADGLDSGHEH